jgi:hypothetical protein
MPITTAGNGLTGISECPKIGGIRRAWFCEVGDVSAITTSASAVTDITFASSGVGFEEIEFKRNEAELTENGDDPRVNNVELSISLPNPTGAQRALLEELKDTCKMYAVVELFNDESAITGDNRLLFIGYDAKAKDTGFLTYSGHSGTSGRAKTDDSMLSLTFMAEQAHLVYELTGLSGVSATSLDDIFQRRAN